MKTIAFFLATVAAGTAFAAGADATAAIEALGRVNGQALACNQPAIGSRARNALVTTAPKTRESGETFEAATNAAYLEQGGGRTCPDAAALNQALAAAEARLQAVFPAAR